MLALAFWLIPVAVVLVILWSLGRDGRRKSRGLNIPPRRKGLGPGWWLWNAAILAFGGVIMLVKGQWLWAAFILGAAVWHCSRARSEVEMKSSDDG